MKINQSENRKIKNLTTDYVYMRAYEQKVYMYFIYIYFPDIVNVRVQLKCILQTRLKRLNWVECPSCPFFQMTPSVVCI